MAKRYEPKVIEPKWQQAWADSKIYEADEQSDKPKMYATPMLPYPSGTGLHTGHVRNYSITDAVARFYRQRGYNTLSTIAWDAFGLPAENFAIKTGTPPAESTAKNIAYFKEQLLRLGMSYAWDREFNTSDPSYYKWTQWVFAQLYKRGLAYQAEKMQWWCDSCKTVLADEQVAAGKCWRHDGADDPLVTKKSLKQWFFKITDYADEILEATDALNWPEKIKTMQKNWIGRSEGALIQFATDKGPLEVFTTRPDTIYGATFLVIAPEHPLLTELVSKDQKEKVDAYVAEAVTKDEITRMDTSREKTGVWTGSYAVNPLSGEKLPIWTADYVLAGYGTGAIMAVPAHDQRDKEFALAFNLPIIDVVRPVTGTPQQNPEYRQSIVAIVKNPETGKFLSINWGKNAGGNLFIGGGRDEGEDPIETAQREIREETGFTNVRLIARTPTEIEHHYFAASKNVARRIDCVGLYFELVDDTREQTSLEADEQGKFSVEWLSEKEIGAKVTDELHKTCFRLLVQGEVYHDEGLMVQSGDYDGLTSSEARERIVADLEKKGIGMAKVQYKMRDWLISRQRYWGAPIPIIHCEEHGAVLVPDDQLPVELPYVEKYAPDGSNTSVLAGAKDWVNTTCPTCGKPAQRETDTMDGYVCSTWYLHRYTDAHNAEAAFDSSKVNYWFPLDYYFGADHAVAHLLYIRFFNRVLADMGLIDQDKKEPVKQLVFNGYINAEDGAKMSKSKGNTVDPMDIIDSGYGADALRVFELFIAPYEQDTNWNTNGVPGTYRFLQRVWNIVQEFADSNSAEGSPNDTDILRIAHKTVKKVTQDLEKLSFNTAVAAMMEMTNDLFLIKAKNPVTKSEAWTYVVEAYAQLLGPFAPHIAEEIWHDIGHTDSVHVSHWPAWDERYLVSDTQIYAVQVNGKVRAEITVPSDAGKDDVIAAARADEKVAQYVAGDPKKVIFVPNRLVSFVV